jgi:hypothetical protein
MEAAITKGDFSKDGLSGSYALTYTNSKVQYQSGLINNNGANQIGYYNQALNDYNALAKGGTSNFPCFTLAQPATPTTNPVPGTGVGTPGTAQACGAGTVVNPYFSAPAQSLLDPNGWYAPASNVALPGVNSGLGLYDAPWVNTLILNYRHDKWAVTPSLQLSSGSSYGSPITVQGVDPRECSAVDNTDTVAANECAYTSVIGTAATTSGLLYIPNPQTGTFDGIGAYHQPNILVGNIALSYDVTPKISINLTVSNLYHTCFGGSKEAWTSAYPAGQNVCGYFANGLYVSNYQLGNGYATPGVTSSYSATANGTSLFPWQQQSYAPSNGAGAAGTIPPPINAYLTVNIKL